MRFLGDTFDCALSVLCQNTTFRDLALLPLLGKTKSYKNRLRWARSVELTTVPQDQTYKPNRECLTIFACIL